MSSFKELHSYSIKLVLYLSQLEEFKLVKQIPLSLFLMRSCFPHGKINSKVS